MGDEQPFDLADKGRGFESLAVANGTVWWRSADIAEALGYTAFPSFFKAIQKAMTTCLTLGIPLSENFREAETSDCGEQQFKLSRFACFLIAMNGDTSKPQVARAQAYFVTLAEAFEQFVNAANVERVLIRDEVSQHEKSLSSTAAKAGVTEYQFFRNAGYRGMYNMSLSKLKEYKGFGANNPRSLLDFMGKEELAANLFRVTQTEAKIKAESIQGQRGLELAAHDVGRRVRKTMREISGQRPEDLPLVEDIKKVHSGIKQTRKQLEKIDKK